jgi:hypothetical protein
MFQRRAVSGACSFKDDILFSWEPAWAYPGASRKPGTSEGRPNGTRQKCGGFRKALRGLPFICGAFPRIPVAAATSILGYFLRSLRERVHALTVFVIPWMHTSMDTQDDNLSREAYFG